MELAAASIQQKLWHEMRTDLARYSPEVAANDRLMCCCCFRPLKQDDFDLEHIIPESALADDPPEVKTLFTVNERSKNVLLCKKPLTVKGRSFHSKGCNNWKGKFFDPCLRRIMNGTALSENVHRRFDSQHSVAIMVLAYLALVHRFGYQVALTPGGVLMRRQFFSPINIRAELSGWPWGIVLSGTPMRYDPKHLDIWTNPFSFTPETNRCMITIRHIATFVPLSRDPRTPIAHQLKYTPERFNMKPNFRTAFD